MFKDTMESINQPCIPSKVVTTVPDAVEFVKKVATLRGADDKFGVVTKGFCCLDWKNFVHHTGPYNIGVSTKKTKEKKY